MGHVWMQIAWLVVASCSICLGSLSDPKTNLLLKAVVPSSSGAPWPMPQSMTTTSDVYTLVGEDQFTFSSQLECDILQSAFNRYGSLIFFNSPRAAKKPRFPAKYLRFSASAELSGINVAVNEPCPTYPNLEDDESYTLTVSTPNASLTAKTVWGALRGLETFSQLIYDGADSTHVINKTSINDFPRFNYRGYMIDTSRHFLSMSSIFKSLDAMAYNKFNVLHWHIVDDPSFPYQSQAFPSLSGMNAYDQHHVYTRDNIKAVIEYARLRGIRVMPEFDTPGHTQSWVSIPNLLTKCYSGTTPNGNYGPIDPTVDANYEFLKTFFQEVVDLFPDKYVHMGGDEVSFTCWASNPAITAFMEAHQFGKNYSMLEQYYEQRLLDIMADLQSGYTVWQEIIDNQVKVRADTVVHIWKGGWQDEATKVTTKGYKTILSTPWYLNYISYGSDWQNYYKVEPTAFNGTDAQKALVMGGEVCMWGEYVDSTNVIQRTWPRASAVGERLWSAKTVTSVNDAAPRLVEQRCRMVRRGLQAEPIVGPNHCPYEYQDGF